MKRTLHFVHLSSKENNIESTFLKKGSTKSTQILGLIHSLIYGPLQTYTYGDYKYFITFIYDKPRYFFVYLMKFFFETFDKFLIYKAFVEKTK
jgi:hypothetical protein